MSVFCCHATRSRMARERCRAGRASKNEVLNVQIVPKRNVAIEGKNTAKFRLSFDDGLSEVGFVVTPCSPGPVVVRIIGQPVTHRDHRDDDTRGRGPPAR
jgi:hypothetical protein